MGKSWGGLDEGSIPRLDAPCRSVLVGLGAAQMGSPHEGVFLQCCFEWKTCFAFVHLCRVACASRPRYDDVRVTVSRARDAWGPW